MPASQTRSTTAARFDIAADVVGEPILVLDPPNPAVICFYSDGNVPERLADRIIDATRFQPKVTADA